MNGLTLNSIRADDAGFVDALLSASLPIDDLDDDVGSFHRLRVNSATVGYGGYELHGDCALIRSLVILESHRGRGLGSVAAKQVVEQAKLTGAKKAYLLTNSAKAFFERLGFSEIDRSAAPSAILQTRQASSICPSSAALMVLDLQE